MSLVAHLRMISLAFLIVAIVGSTSASPAWAQRIAPAGVSLLRADAASASPLAPTSFAPQRSRPWWRYPVIGATVVGVGGELVYLAHCSGNTDDGCMGGLGPLGFGAVVGATLGGIAELVHRRVERAR